MSYLDFILSIVDSLVWPITLVSLIILFRSPISKIISNLEKISYKDAELAFKKDFLAIEIAAKAAQIDSTQIQTEDMSEHERQSIDRNLEEEVEAVANISPTAAISLAWSIIESELMRTVLRLSLTPKEMPRRSALKNASTLKNAGLLEIETISLIDKMRLLRNKIADDRMPQSAIAIDEAIDYWRLAQSIVGKLKSLKFKQFNSPTIASD